MTIDNNSANKQIAKNTIMLYMRTIIVLFISLYSSRLLLKALGVEDMGIYNVVGGIVSLMAVLQGAQTTTTSRFITYDLGQNKPNEQLSKTFSACMTIHIIIAAFILLSGETLGLYIVNHWVDVPPERAYAANIVYQMALVTFILNVIRVPYNAIIIAHEKMNVFASFSIAEALLKFLMICLIKNTESDHLIMYSISLVLVNIAILIVYFVYVKKNYSEYVFRWFWNKEYSYQIISFSGWTLTSNATNTVTQQGVSLLFNNFVGLVANAALGFANQVNMAVGQFVSSFTTAFNPQIIKLWSKGNLVGLHKLMNRASKFSFALVYVFTLPLISNMDYILHLWLKDVPEYTTEFAQLILICSTIDATTGVYNTAITASGKLMKYNLLISCSFVLDLICSFVLLSLKIHPAMVFCSRILTRGLLNMIIGLIFSRILVFFNIKNYFKETLLPIALILLITIPCIAYVTCIYDGVSQLIVSIILSVVLIALCTFYIIMDKNERLRILLLLKDKLKRI